MNVDDSSRVALAYQIAAGEQPVKRKPRSAAAPKAIDDTAAILGVPESELTDKVRTAIGTLLEEVDTLRRELKSARTRLAELEALADSDGLTPLLNRRAFVRELNRMIAYSQRYGAPASLLYFDLNGFKAINDRFGHTAGDEALIHIAKLLIDQTRASDIVARIGGDEFGVVLAQANEQAAQAKAEGLRRAIVETPLVWEGHTIALDASYGLYVFQRDSDPNRALAEADRSMYLNKDTRRV